MTSAKLKEEVLKVTDDERRDLIEALWSSLRQAQGGARVQRQHHLDRFAGLWSTEEAAEFDAILAEQRQIDPDLWR